MSFFKSGALARLFNLQWVSLLIAALVLLPVLAVLQQAIFAGNDLLDHLWRTVLVDYVSNSLLLMVAVAFGTLAIGVPAAWLTSMCRFPGRRWLDWSLLLPMAMPAYIIAYTYTGILDFAGPVQTWIRSYTGWGYNDYWLWQIRSMHGAMVLMVLVLYPYVYLTSRAAFLEQSVVSMEVARTLGYGPWRAWIRVAVPMARPAIIAGMSLAMMETLADYGTVKYFGITTFTTGIFRTFYGYGDAAGASQLAVMLLFFILSLILLERWSRNRQAYHIKIHSSAKPIILQGWRSWLAFTVCLLPVLFGFLIPALQLVWWSVLEADIEIAPFWSLIWNSFSLALLSALLATFLALLLAYAQHFYPKKMVHNTVHLAGLGYALPGTIIAIGILLPLTWLDRSINDIFSYMSWGSPGLLLSGSVFVLLLAYCVRFLAVALSSVQSGLGNLSPNLDKAGKSLGHNAWYLLRVIHIPLIRSSVLTAVLVVFVDVLKELPATLMLRPFDFSTLAVRAYELASDEQLIAAAPASLMIVLVGLLPVLLLNLVISRKRSY